MCEKHGNIYETSCRCLEGIECCKCCQEVNCECEDTVIKPETKKS